MKPIIGLIPLVDEARESLWMLPGYMEGLRWAGGLPVMLPLTTDEAEIAGLCARCDAFLFTGGHDVSPEVYGQNRLEVCGDTSPERDAMEAAVLRCAMDDRKPALGICRGIQLINACLGGTLWQDLPTQRPTDTEHHQRPPYHRPAHPVTVFPGTPMRKALGRDQLWVNSYHHQGIRELAAPLRAMACADDGLVEAVYCPDHPFLWAVQWHPEFAWRGDEPSRDIFRAFVAAAEASLR